MVQTILIITVAKKLDINVIFIIKLIQFFFLEVNVLKGTLLSKPNLSKLFENKLNRLNYFSVLYKESVNSVPRPLGFLPPDKSISLCKSTYFSIFCHRTCTKRALPWPKSIGMIMIKGGDKIQVFQRSLRERRNIELISWKKRQGFL